MKEFKELLNNGVVKKQQPNRQRSLSLVSEVMHKKTYLETT
jgi:hypothetical protein